ncbi:MAG: polyprenyl synthetase family protein [Lentisphaeraceae bacterium]|nr:polyprenyl synthetase family protein [Lentisphaeraceae bacterium]
MQTATEKSLKDVHEKYSSLLDETNSLIRQHILTLAPQSKQLDSTLEASRGKQLRPLFTYSIFHGFGSQTEKAPHLAAIFESIHVASLLHDDVIDDCHLRRNMPTMNEIYGSGVAILLGDLVFVAIYRLAAALDEMWLIQKVNETIHVLIEGELLQQQRKFDEKSTESDYKGIISRKTASLLELCCYASAKYSGQNEESAIQLQNFGKNFGIIFQIVDDWADFCRSRKDDHKDRGVDIANGFLTLPWILLLEKCNEQEKDSLIKVIEAQKPAGLDNPLVQNLSDKYDIPKLIHDRISEHYRSASDSLNGLADFDDSELRIFLDFVMAEFNKILVSV